MVPEGKPLRRGSNLRQGAAGSGLPGATGRIVAERLVATILGNILIVLKEQCKK
jgi:hypothetical protein